MPKIVLIGGFGWHDVGDESQLTNSIINLKKFIPSAEFMILSDNPENTSKYHKLATSHSINHYLFPDAQNLFSKVMRRLSLSFWIRGFILLFNAQCYNYTRKTFFLNKKGKLLLETLGNSDLLFNVGGGNLNSIWRFEGLYGKCFTYLVSKTLKKPVILSGQTIGPIDSWFDRKFAGFALNHVDVITLRDSASKSVLNDLGIFKPIILETADDAVSLPCTNDNSVAEVLLERKDVANRPMIGLNMLGLNYYSTAKAKAVLAQVADYLASKLDAVLVFVPMEYLNGADDRVALNDVFQLMKCKQNVIKITSEHDDKTLKSIIGRLDLAIGFRYHFIVFATTMQVPSIGLYQDAYYAMKIQGILSLMEQEQYACNIKDVSACEIIALVDDLLMKRTQIASKLKERTEILSERGLFSIRCAAKILELSR